MCMHYVQVRGLKLAAETQVGSGLKFWTSYQSKWKDLSDAVGPAIAEMKAFAIAKKWMTADGGPVNE